VTVPAKGVEIQVNLLERRRERTHRDALAAPRRRDKTRAARRPGTANSPAFGFLLPVGVALVADALNVPIPRGYAAGAIAFSLGVEPVNPFAGRRRVVGR